MVALGQTMALRQSADKPLSEPMIFSLLTFTASPDLNALICIWFWIILPPKIVAKIPVKENEDPL